MRKLVTVAVIVSGLGLGSLGGIGVALADEAPAEKVPVDKHMGSAGSAADKHHHDPSKHFNYLGSPGEHYGKDVMGGKYGDGVMVDDHGVVTPGEEPMSAPFIFLLLNFALLLIILAWKGKPAIEKLAADRHDQIKSALDEAEKLRKQASEKLSEYTSKVAGLDTEIKKIVDGLKADAEADKQRMLESADRQAAQMQRDADARIAAEIEAARALLTREVTDAAIGAAEKILRQKGTAEDQTNLVNAFIAGVDQTRKERDQA